MSDVKEGAEWLAEAVKTGSKIWADVPDNFVNELRGGEMKTVKTLGSKMAPADICRANGWGAGTVLRGDKFNSVTITITGIGEKKILARNVNDEWEGTWTFDNQEWSEVKDDHDYDGLWKCTVCGRVGSVGRCCGDNTRVKHES